jgi:HTH-type transcriptional regulator, sugar sensing transcriptional regulator
MKIESLQKTLENFGLSENEAAVYLAALSLGPSTILALSRAAGVKRTTVYSVILALQNKGLLIRNVKGWKTFFAAEPPEKLENIIESKKAELLQALPDLSSLYNLKGDDGSIQFYDGIEAVKSVYDSLIRDVRAHEDYLVLSDLDQWLSLDAKFFQNFIERRAKLPINIRILSQDSKTARKLKQNERAYNEKIKFLPQGTALTTNLVITPQRVVIHQLVPPVFAMSIANPNVIRMHKEQFEIMWKALPE